MTKELNKTIRSFKDILKNLEAINVDIIFDEYGGIYDFEMSKYHIKGMIEKVEEKYQNLHKMGAHND